LITCKCFPAIVDRLANSKYWACHLPGIPLLNLLGRCFYIACCWSGDRPIFASFIQFSARKSFNNNQNKSAAILQRFCRKMSGNQDL